MVDSDGGKPSLDDARARIARAGEHIARLEREVVQLSRQQHTLFQVEPTERGPLTGEFNPPIIFSVLIGEVVYNLKAALDYLVYELAYLDSGRPQQGTKFLIEDSEDALAKPAWFRKLSPPHQAELKRLQPFAGVEWTRELARLTNPDKHRRLTRVEGSTNAGVYVELPPDVAMPAMFPKDMFMKVVTEAQVAFINGRPVIETLHHLQKQVADVIEAFDSDFQ